MQVDASNRGSPVFDVNLALRDTERQAVHALLQKRIGAFATNPKRPSELKTAGHHVTLLDPQPIKQRRYEYHLTQNRRSRDR